jgi:hypothetical protein
MISIQLNQQVFDAMIAARVAEVPDIEHECGDQSEACVACLVHKLAGENDVIRKVLAGLSHFAIHQVAAHGKTPTFAIEQSVRIAYLNGFADAIKIANNQVLEASLTRAESRAADDTGREERTCPE